LGPIARARRGRPLDTVGLDHGRGSATDDDHMTFEGKLAPITEFRATHVPLWIEYGDGVAVAMLERDDPRREAIVGTFRERLGSRWIDHLTTAQAAMRIFKPIPSAAGVRRRSTLWPIIAIVVLVLEWIALAVVAHSLRRW
jgi:hypothetical protein